MLDADEMGDDGATLSKRERDEEMR